MVVPSIKQHSVYPSRPFQQQPLPHIPHRHFIRQQPCAVGQSQPPGLRIPQRLICLPMRHQHALHRRNSHLVKQLWCVTSRRQVKMKANHVSHLAATGRQIRI